MDEGYSVTVSKWGTPILTIEPAMVSGKNLSENLYGRGVIQKANEDHERLIEQLKAMAEKWRWEVDYCDHQYDSLRFTEPQLAQQNLARGNAFRQSAQKIESLIKEAKP